MPFLKIQTNVEYSSAQQQKVIKAVSETVAEILGKPERYVMVCFEQNPNMIFAGSIDPLVYMEMKNIELNEGETRDYSSSLCKVISRQLGVNANRIYIEFTNAQRHLWGWNETTF